MIFNPLRFDCNSTSKVYNDITNSVNDTTHKCSYMTPELFHADPKASSGKFNLLNVNIRSLSKNFEKLKECVKALRVRAFFHKAVRVCHVYCNFKIGFTCRITVIFGTLKDGSLLINTLASNICFSYRNMFQNGVDALSKIVDAFLSKSSKFHLVRIIR